MLDESCWGSETTRPRPQVRQRDADFLRHRTALQQIAMQSHEYPLNQKVTQMHFKENRHS
jgi:hypothetical protein